MKQHRAKRWIKRSVILFALFLLAWLILKSSLPSIIESIVERQLAARGYKNVELQVEVATTEYLHITHAKLSSTGWDLQMKDTRVSFDSLKSIIRKELRSLSFDTLEINLDLPELMASSEDSFDLLLLKQLPIKEASVKEGLLSIHTTSGNINTVWRGQLSNSEQISLEATIDSIEAVDQISTDQQRIVVSDRKGSKNKLTLTVGKEKPYTEFHLGMSKFWMKGPGWTIEECGLSTELHLKDFDIFAIQQMNKDLLADQFMTALSGICNFNSNRMTYGDLTAEWINMDLTIDPQKATHPINSQLGVRVGTATAAGESIDQIELHLNTSGNSEELKSDGILDFNLDGTNGKASIQQTARKPLNNMSLKGGYNLHPMIFDYSDILGRQLPSLEDLSISGSLSATGDYRYDSSGFDASSRVTFSNGSAELPSSKLSVAGVDFNVDLQSLSNLTTALEQSAVTIKQIQIGDIGLQESKLDFELNGPNQISINHSRSNLFEGTITLSPFIISTNPLTFDSVLTFEELSLESITDKMSFFDGTMEGFINGHLPFNFREGTFRWGEGLLTLSPGEKARLQYNTKGLFEPSKSKKTGLIKRFSDELMQRLKLAPETVVKDALSDLSIHTLRIDLLSSETPETPVRIQLGGEGKSGKAIVPLNLDTNINGTLDELTTFLLQMSSLGIPSLE